MSQCIQRHRSKTNLARRNRVDSRTHRRDRRQLLGYRCWTLWTRFRDFYDRGPEFNDVAEDDPENYPGGENERYLEIWNLVFSEFNHQADGTYEPLPHKTLIRGWGLNGWCRSSKMHQPTLKQISLCRSSKRFKN